VATAEFDPDIESHEHRQAAGPAKGNSSSHDAQAANGLSNKI